MDLDQLFFKFCTYYPVVLLRGQKVPAYPRSLKETQWDSQERLVAIQNRKLQALVGHAMARIPFYQKTLQRVSGRSHFLIRDLYSLPFVSKSDLQRAQRQFLQPGAAIGLSRKTTGGSTGEAVTLWKTAESIAQEHAANWRGFEWAGIRIGDRQGRFWGAPHGRRDRLRSHIADFVANRKRCSAFAFNEKDMRDYTKTLNRFKPRYLYGYVSMLAAYAEYVKSSNDPLQFDLKAVITTSEVLTSYHRKLFEDTFGAKVFNEYGCGELGTIAHECEQGSMHINAENLIVEILRDDKPCAPHEIGEVVITELNNTAMPLIRYRLGDFASFSGQPCRCGRILPVIENIAGRAYDMVYNRQGRMFHGEFFMYIFEEVNRRNLGIRSFQVIQEDFENFTIRVVATHQYGPETEQLVRTRIQEGYGKDANVAFVHVSEIGREPSGKMRLIAGLQSRP